MWSLATIDRRLCVCVARPSDARVLNRIREVFMMTAVWTEKRRSRNYHPLPIGTNSELAQKCTRIVMR